MTNLLEGFGASSLLNDVNGQFASTKCAISSTNSIDKAWPMILASRMYLS